MLGVILEETSPEELQVIIIISFVDSASVANMQLTRFILCPLQKQATIQSSVLEVLLEITKFGDLYLMERVLDDESEVSALLTLLYYICMSISNCY